MGLPPKGKIVGRPMVARACGCVKEFQLFEVDKYRAERLAKFQKSRCPECVAKLIKEQRQTTQLPRTEAMKLLPRGTQVSLTLGQDGNWTGTLLANGKQVESTGEPGSGPQALVLALARLWIVADRGTGKAGGGS